MPINPFHPFTISSFVSPAGVERSLIVFWRGPNGTMARREPSGDKLQLQSGSVCNGPETLPVLTSKRKVSAVTPFVMLYMHVVDNTLAHCRFHMRKSLRTLRGAPPAEGIARMEERVSELRALGVEIYRTSEPS